MLKGSRPQGGEERGAIEGGGGEKEKARGQLIQETTNFSSLDASKKERKKKKKGIETRKKRRSLQGKPTGRKGKNRIFTGTTASTMRGGGFGIAWENKKGNETLAGGGGGRKKLLLQQAKGEKKKERPKEGILEIVRGSTIPERYTERIGELRGTGGKEMNFTGKDVR